MRSYVDRGYIIVQQDVRGRYMSEGEFMHVRPAGFGSVDETTDSYDTVDWLVKNIPGNNGRVGFAGCSYPGFYALMGGLSGHPAVKAVSPQAPVTDWYMGDDVHHNGVLMLSDAVRFLNSMNTPAGHEPTDKMPRRGLTISPDERTFFLTERPTRADPDETSGTQCVLGRDGRTSRLRRVVARARHAPGLLQHPSRDAGRGRHVRRRGLLRGLEPLQSRPAPERPDSAPSGRRAVGPRGMARRRAYAGRLRFRRGGLRSLLYGTFRGALFRLLPLGARHGSTGLPPVAAFSSGDNRWHTFGRWTPSEARKLTLYLADGGRITTEKPTVKNSSTSYTSDPADPVPYIATSGTRRPKEYMIADQRFLEGRKDVLTFVTEPLAEDVTLAGPVEASLKVALSTSDADFVVKLIDVYPDEGEKAGMQLLVRGDVVRGRYRDGFTRPKAFVPGNPETVPFRTTDIAHTFRAGHRIMVQVQSSWFPLTERNPQQFIDLWRCAASDFVPCRVTLFHQRDRASSLTVYKL